MENEEMEQEKKEAKKVFEEEKINDYKNQMPIEPLESKKKNIHHGE